LQKKYTKSTRGYILQRFWKKVRAEPSEKSFLLAEPFKFDTCCLEIVKRGKEVDKVEALLKVAAWLYMIGF